MLMISLRLKLQKYSLNLLMRSFYGLARKFFRIDERQTIDYSVIRNEYKIKR